MKNWVIPGTAKPNSSPGVNHNVSNTITVKENEWDGVMEFIWKNRQYFSGVSLLADIGDKVYANAPREEVKTDTDEANWSNLIFNYKHIDWTQFIEDDDNTTLAIEKACAGGACNL
jgi:ribonucleoside-diphosphate reductase alpha chain